MNKKNDFIYFLHEEDIFQYKLFESFIFDIINRQDEIEKDIKLKGDVIHKLIYSLKLFIYHFNTDDIFEIINFKEINENKSEIIDVIGYVITQLSCNKPISKKYIKEVLG